MKSAKRTWAGLLLVVAAAVPLWSANPGLVAEFTDLGGSVSAIPDFAAFSPNIVRVVDAVDQPSTGGAWPGLPLSMKDTFAARLHGSLAVPAAGTWTFHLISDDGSRLLLDGVEVIDNDGLHGMRTRSATLTLAAGPHAVEVEFFENGGGAGLQLYWEGPGVARQRVPAGAFTHERSALPAAPAAVPTLPGLAVSYYDFAAGLSSLPDVSGVEPDVVRIEPVIDQPSDSQAWDGLPPSMADTFAAVATGCLAVPADGNWDFWLTSDDGSRLIVGGTILIDNDGLHAMRTRSAGTWLAAGTHPLELRFFENAGGAGLRLEWAGPGVPRQVVPASAFCHEVSGALPGDRVGPFRWARKLFDPLQPASVDVAANGLTETAVLAAGGDADAGVVLTEQWSGTNEAGGRSWSANTLVGDPGRNYFVGMMGWTNVEAVDTGLEWIEVSRMQQDAHLRLAFVGAAAAELAVTHGTDFGLDWIVPAPAVVLDLSFRRLQGTGDSTWQTGYYRGNPVQLGVWQVPAGMSLGQAQADVTNRLALLPVLGEITPDDDLLVKLQVQPDGAWQVLLDLDGDGQVDVDVVSGTAGAAPYDAAALGDIDESSGLLVTASPAGGVHVPDVGITRIPLAYAASPSEPITTPRDRRPILLATHHVSPVSPATIEGGTWTGDRTITVEPCVGLSHFANGKFFAKVPLVHPGPTSFTATQVGVPATTRQGLIEWTVTNLDAVDAITINAGDRLLLACHEGYPAGEPVCIDVYGDGSDVRSGLDEEAHEVPYPTPGVYPARAWSDLDGDGTCQPGEELGTCTVTVVDYRLPAYIAAERGFTRDLYIADAATPVVAHADADQALTVTEAGRDAGTIFLRLRAEANDEPVLEARAGAPDGPLLDARAIATFDLTELTGSVIPVLESYPDGSQVLEGKLRMSPIRPDLDIRLQIFVSGAAFPDGGLTTWVSSNDFASDPAATDGSGTMTFTLIKSADAPTGPCHNRRVYQAGTQVGD